MSDRQILADNNTGTLWNNGGNETIQDSKIADASKFRVGAPYEAGQSGGGGAFSFDVTGGNIPGMHEGKRIEVVLQTGAMNREGGGETGLFVTRRGTWGNISDEAQVRIWEITSDRVEFKVPISAPNLGGGGGTGGNRQRLETADGRYVWQLQNDPAHGAMGAIIVYDTHGNIADEAGWTAVAKLAPTPL